MFSQFLFPMRNWSCTIISFTLPVPSKKAIKHGSGSLNSDFNIYYPEQDGFIEVDNTAYNSLDQLQQELETDLHSFNKDPLLSAFMKKISN